MPPADLTPLNGFAVAMVRPYLVRAWEQRELAKQQKRRDELEQVVSSGPVVDYRVSGRAAGVFA
ncbi:hypothetical protein [Streptodolium elevatio]